jgi:hypothetical protein
MQDEERIVHYVLSVTSERLKDIQMVKYIQANKDTAYHIKTIHKLGAQNAGLLIVKEIGTYSYH